MSQHLPKPPTEEGEEGEQVKDIKEVQEEQEEALQEEAGGLKELNFLTQIALVSGIYHLHKRENVHKAFRTLNDPHFEYNLLKVKHPQSFEEIQKAQAIAGREIERQKKIQNQREKLLGKTGVKIEKRDYAQIGFGPFRKRINHKDFDRKKEACKVANAVQKGISANSLKIKLNNTINTFGLDEEHTGKLKKSLKEWVKKNPGKSIDGCDSLLLVEGKRLYSSQAVSNNVKVKESELKEKHKTLGEQFDSARVEAAKENREEIVRAQEKIKQALNPTDPTQPILEISREEILEVLHGPSIPTEAAPSPAIPTPTPQPAPQPQVEIAPTSTPTPTLPTTPAPPSKPSHVPSISPITKPIKLPSAISRVATRIKNRLVSSIANNTLVQTGKTMVKEIIGKILSSTIKTGAKFLGKEGLKQLIGSTVPVVGNAIALATSVLNKLAKSLTGIDVEDVLIKFALKAALFAVAVPIGLLLLVLLGLTSGSSSSTLFPIGSKNAMIIPSSSGSGLQGNLPTWGEFEKECLVVGERTGLTERPGLLRDNWRQFEKENLIPYYKHLSLEQK